MTNQIVAKMEKAEITEEQIEEARVNYAGVPNSSLIEILEISQKHAKTSLFAKTQARLIQIILNQNS